MIVTQSSDPREDWWLLASHTSRHHRKTFHSLIQFSSRSQAEGKARKLKADSEVMNGTDIEAAKRCIADAGRGPQKFRDDVTMADLRFLYPPRFNIQVMRLKSGERRGWIWWLVAKARHGFSRRSKSAPS